MSTRMSEGSATVDKALDVLDAVGASPGGLSQIELAARLALPKTTMYRLLGTLVARGMLRRDPLRRVYCLGFRCFEYARQAYAMPDLAASASVELRSLRDLTGETTYLATLDGLEVISLDRCDGAHSQRSAAVLGQRKPLHCTSQGKAILSAMPAAQRDALIKDISLPALTPRTLTDRRRLQTELKISAARGYAIDDEEIVRGVRCCGAPIVDAAGQVRGAISVAGPAFRLTMERVELLGPEVAQAARRIGAQLGSTHAVVGDAEVAVVEGERAFHGAFPVWMPEQGALLWADTLAPTVHELLEAGPGTSLVDRCRTRLESPVLALLREAQATLVQHEDGWLRLHDDGRREAAPDLPARTLQAVVADPAGQLWACAAEGSRWQVGALGSDGRLSGGWWLPAPATALAWSADGGHLVAVVPDSGDVLSLHPGQGSARRVATIPKGSGRVSGLALDGEGGIWTALCDGWSVMRMAADGAIDRVVGLPVPCPTALAFCGAARDRLCIVSARHSLPVESLLAAPLSGRVFSLQAGVQGQAVFPRAAPR